MGGGGGSGTDCMRFLDRLIQNCDNHGNQKAP